MRWAFELFADELDHNFVEAIRLVFRDRWIQIVVEELDSAENQPTPTKTNLPPKPSQPALHSSSPDVP